MADEAFHAAERHRVARDLQVAEELESGRFAARKFHREDSAGIRALLLENALLFGVGEERRIVNGSEMLVAVERLGEPLRVLALAVHAQLDGGKAAIEHPAFVRRQDVAE